jgi:hypothetical protein
MIGVALGDGIFLKKVSEIIKEIQSKSSSI